ncbi:MAG: hypothetical protein J5507_03585 [Clostridia bacterium]|nr:hypothetical protein [Clostridia bacterium]
MIPFFIILGILIIFFLINVLFFLSVIEIQIKKFIYDSESKKNEFLIYIKLKFLNKITWSKIKVDNKKIERYKNANSKLLEKISVNLKREILDKGDIKRINTSNLIIKKINLKIKINLFDPVLTSYAVGILFTILSIIIAKFLEEYNKQNCKYKIIPLYYSKKPEIKVNFSSIINIKVIHILNIGKIKNDNILASNYIAKNKVK